MSHTQTADHILNRMTEVQKIKMYRATPGELDRMHQTMVGYGPVTPAVFAEMKQKVDAKFTTWDDTLPMVPSTWKW